MCSSDLPVPVMVMLLFIVVCVIALFFPGNRLLVAAALVASGYVLGQYALVAPRLQAIQRLGALKREELGRLQVDFQSAACSQSVDSVIMNLQAGCVSAAAPYEGAIDFDEAGRRPLGSEYAEEACGDLTRGDLVDGDERLSYQGVVRNEPTRVVAGTMNRRRDLEKYLAEEVEEEEKNSPWWGHHEY